jgi:hypothetical protein
MRTDFSARPKARLPLGVEDVVSLDPVDLVRHEMLGKFGVGIDLDAGELLHGKCESISCANNFADLR